MQITKTYMVLKIASGMRFFVMATTSTIIITL